MSAFSVRADGISIALKVKAGSKRESAALEAEWLKVSVQAPAVDGKANAAVIALLADRLALPRAAIEILRGEKDTKKVVLVRGATLADVTAAFG